MHWLTMNGFCLYTGKEHDHLHIKSLEFKFRVKFVQACVFILGMQIKNLLFFFQLGPTAVLPKTTRSSSPSSNVVVLPSGTSIHIKGKR